MSHNEEEIMRKPKARVRNKDLQAGNRLQELFSTHCVLGPRPQSVGVKGSKQSEKQDWVTRSNVHLFFKGFIDVLLCIFSFTLSSPQQRQRRNLKQMKSMILHISVTEVMDLQPFIQRCSSKMRRTSVSFCETLECTLGCCWKRRSRKWELLPCTELTMHSD